jgi:hypothetical protein
LTFIDDYSRRTFVYFLKIEDVKALVENETGNKVEVLISGHWKRICQKF